MLHSMKTLHSTPKPGIPTLEQAIVMNKAEDERLERERDDVKRWTSSRFTHPPENGILWTIRDLVVAGGKAAVATGVDDFMLGDNNYVYDLKGAKVATDMGAFLISEKILAPALMRQLAVAAPNLDINVVDLISSVVADTALQFVAGKIGILGAKDRAITDYLLRSTIADAAFQVVDEKLTAVAVDVDVLLGGHKYVVNDVAMAQRKVRKAGRKKTIYNFDQPITRFDDAGNKV